MYHNSDINKILSGNVNLLKKIVDIHESNVASKILLLAENVTDLFNLLITDESEPFLSLRNDDSTLTKFTRICFKHLYPLFNLHEDITFKQVMELEIPHPIAVMCYRLDRAQWKHPKSHILSVTAILTLRGICPKLIVHSRETAKQIMKVAGITSISEVDMSSDIPILIKSMTGDFHICEKCKKWVCVECKNSLVIDLSQVRKEHDNTPLLNRSGSDPSVGSKFSPRSLFALKDSPRVNKVKKKILIREVSKTQPYGSSSSVSGSSSSSSSSGSSSSGSSSSGSSSSSQKNQITKKKSLQEPVRPISPNNPYIKKVAMYDNFCRDVIYKGYQRVLLERNYSGPRAKIKECDFRGLMSKWRYFFDSESMYLSYGDILRLLLKEADVNLTEDQLLFWDIQFEKKKRRELYRNRLKEITDDELMSKWKQAYINLPF